VSGDFARRIESAANSAELSSIVEGMIRRYCALVEEFSLRNYSPLIRNVINTIDFHLQESLSLHTLAERCNSSPNHLSA
jgi:YesN/AraC family two-component response regulator